jgi:hypothetical protein
MFMHVYEHGIQTFYRGGRRSEKFYRLPCLAGAMAEFVTFLLTQILIFLSCVQSALSMRVIDESMFLAFTIDNGLEDLSSYFFCRVLLLSIFRFGARSALSMIVARVYVWVLVSKHRLKHFMHPSSLSYRYHYLTIFTYQCIIIVFLLGARSALPIRIDPEAMFRF